MSPHARVSSDSVQACSWGFFLSVSLYLTVDPFFGEKYVFNLHILFYDINTKGLSPI